MSLGRLRERVRQQATRPPGDRRRASAVGVAALVGASALAVLVGSLATLGRPGDAAPPGVVPPGATPSPSAAPGGVRDGPVLSHRFGLAGHLMWGDVATAVEQLDAMQAAGFGVVRFDVSWRSIETEPGRYTGLDRLDAIMAAIGARGMRPIVTVIETPAWANGGRDRWVPPDDVTDYARFAALLASRYAGRDVAWEIWNEPNDPRFWHPAPDAAAYARLLIAAADAIHSAVPYATVLGGSILFADERFLEEMYDAGAQGHFDALAIHPYALLAAPDDPVDGYHSFVAAIDRLHGEMQAAGDGDVAIWITEVGWPGGEGGLAEAVRGRYLAEAVRLVMDRPFVTVSAAYTISPADDPAFGLMVEGAVAWSAYAAAVRGTSTAAVR